MVQEPPGLGGGTMSVIWFLVNFNGSLRFESWVDINGHGGVGIMVLKVVSENLERNVDREKKGFFRMRNGCFVGSIIVDKLLIEEFHLKNHSLGFIGDRCNDIRKGVSDVRDNNFKRFIWVNWSIVSVRDWSVAEGSNKVRRWAMRR